MITNIKMIGFNFLQHFLCILHFIEIGFAANRSKALVVFPIAETTADILKEIVLKLPHVFTHQHL